MELGQRAEGKEEREVANERARRANHVQGCNVYWCYRWSFCWSGILRFPGEHLFQWPLALWLHYPNCGLRVLRIALWLFEKATDERWAAFERGMIAPLVFSTLLFNYTPDKGRLDKIFDSSSFVSVAYATSIPKSGVKGAPIIRRIIKGILGK